MVASAFQFQAVQFPFSSIEDYTVEGLWSAEIFAEYVANRSHFINDK